MVNHLSHDLFVPFSTHKVVFCFLFICFVLFLQLYCPTETSPMRNSGNLPRGKSAATKPAATESHYLIYGACWAFSCFHNSPNSDTDDRIFHVHTDVNACDCTRGCTDTVRESALKVDSGSKISCRTGESNLLRLIGVPV